MDNTFTFTNILLIIYAIFMFSMTILIMNMPTENLRTAVIMVDGEEYRRVKLNERSEFDVKGAHIVVRRGGIFFESSDCEDQYCVRGGKIRKTGSTLACLPNNIIIQIECK